MSTSTPAPETPLGSYALQWQSANPGQSGFLPLVRGIEGLGARLRALDAAQLSVDAQYFLIKPDEAGRLFLGKLLVAADRGVKVRLLVDDIFTPRDDRVLATLASHPNIQIRLFNPLSRRVPAALHMLWDFGRTNRRMHNKSFLVDGAAAIVGGRNIAEEYFELKAEDNFNDLEVLAVGPVVTDLYASFDSFWNSELSLPVEGLGRQAEPAAMDRWRKIMQDVMDGNRPSAYARAVNSDFLRRLFRGELNPQAATARVVSDAPEKLNMPPGAEQHLAVADALVEAFLGVKREATIITPYFLPRERARKLMIELASKGMRIRVVTNSLASTNHVPVHAHYRKYRRELLHAGVEIYEMRADRRPGFRKRNGTEYMTLHTKAFELDGETLALGSVNLDPRSIEMNTELVLFIDSPQLSRQLRYFLGRDLPAHTWRLVLDERGRERWYFDGAGEPEVVRREPGASLWRRAWVGLYRLLPIERLL